MGRSSGPVGELPLMKKEPLGRLVSYLLDREG
jgi:hypothetical protein